MKRQSECAIFSSFSMPYLKYVDKNLGSSLVNIVGIVEILNFKNTVAIFAELNHIEKIYNSLTKKGFTVKSRA